MVSIILATYDRAATLARAIDSVVRQTYPDWELIVVDDGSRDETPAILAGIDDRRIRTYRHSHNRGVTAAKNTGLEHIRGDWFTFLDSDDEMTPDALAVMVACAERTGATAITCNCLDSVTGRLTGTGLTADGRISAADAARAGGEHWGLTRTELLGDLRFDERLPGFEDTVWLRIHRRARRYYIHRALRIYHTEGADRITVAGPRRGVGEKVRIYAVLGEHTAYLKELQCSDPRAYRRTMLRVWAARLLGPCLGCRSSASP